MDQFLAGLAEGLATAAVFGAAVAFAWLGSRWAERVERRDEQTARDMTEMDRWRERRDAFDRARRDRPTERK